MEWHEAILQRLVSPPFFTVLAATMPPTMSAASLLLFSVTEGMEEDAQGTTQIDV